jgi:hypothetical protein
MFDCFSFQHHWLACGMTFIKEQQKAAPLRERLFVKAVAVI